jgi:hypothetical protein
VCVSWYYKAKRPRPDRLDTHILYAPYLLTTLDIYVYIYYKAKRPIPVRLHTHILYPPYLLTTLDIYV